MVRWLGIAFAVCGAGCVIGTPDSAVSRFEVSWTFADGTSCEQRGAQRVRVQSTLHGDDPQIFVDDLPCAAEVGRTRPLEPGPYDVQLVALSPEGDVVGLSALQADVVLAPEQTLALALDIGPAP